MENKKTVITDKGRRERLYIALVAILLILFISLQLSIVKDPSMVPLVSEIGVFVLMNVNLVLLLVLIYLVIRNLTKVFIESRKGIKVRIKYKLVLAFLILSIAPAFLLFFIASAFISTSLERWFNIQIERSLDESLKVAKTFYKNSSDNALFYSRRLSSIIKENKYLDQENMKYLSDFVRDKKKEYNLESVEVFSSIKEPLAVVIPDNAKSTDTNSSILREALVGKDSVLVEESKTGDIIRASVPIFSNFVQTEVVGVVVVSYHIPHSMVSKMQIISDTYQKYAKLMIFRKPLKSVLIVTLLITTLIIIFSSVWFGLYMARQITGPLDSMTDVAQKVSDGNMDVRVEISSADEIGQLSDAFNRMLNDLKTKNEIIESQSNYLRILMNKVATGIMSASPDGEIITINDAAKRIFEQGDGFRGSIREFFESCGGGREVFDLFETCKTSQQAEKIVTLDISGKVKYVKVDATSLLDEQQNLLGFVGVFDEITESIRFEKMLAWREVARKVAHEIKNPLTPIQLSANRLKKRYEKFVAEEDRSIFNECIDVIVSQVDDIKNLINEFSNYGRMPALKKENAELSTILNDVHLLFSEAHKNISFGLDIDSEMPPAYCDKDQLKRAIMNLVTNAVEALENVQDSRIDITARYNEKRESFTISIKDNGHGIRREYRDRLFEPYFSRKKGGTGLGLYIVNSIITDHDGTITVADAFPKGSEFIITLPAGMEKT